MKPLFGFLIETNNRYNNSTTVNNTELILNTEITERDFEFVNRIGIVKETPRNNPTRIRKGDKVIVHHNVFRRWFDVRGNERNSSNYIDDDLYICYLDQIFGFNNGNGWEATEGFCFVSPIDNDDDWSYELEKPHNGILEFKGDDLEIPLGSRVGFTQGSEYEFVIDGQKMYRVLSHQINVDYGFQEETKRNNQISRDRIEATG